MLWCIDTEKQKKQTQQTNEHKGHQTSRLRRAPREIHGADAYWPLVQSEAREPTDSPPQTGSRER